MPKSIPTIGDSNWGTPLNNHLSQLLNPITGGINSFEQFSQRPTTLISDDIGKTYLYTQTGNLHQWTGTTWKVLNESVINVKDYGAIGDGVADDTAAVQFCIDNYATSTPFSDIPPGGKKSSIFFPQGKYRITSTINLTSNGTDGKIRSCVHIHFENRSSYTQQGTLLMGETGPKPVIECTGSDSVWLENVGIICGNTNQSQIGILQARQMYTNGGFGQAFRYKFDNVYISLKSHATANNGLGSICLINISCEEGQYDFIELWGNTPLICSDSYILSFTNNRLDGRKTFNVTSAFGFTLVNGYSTTLLSFTGTSRMGSWDHFSPVILFNAIGRALGGITFDLLFIIKSLPTNLPGLGMGPDSGTFPSATQTSQGRYPYAIEVSGSVGSLDITASVEGCGRIMLVNGDIGGSNITIGTDGFNYASLDNRTLPFILLNSIGITKNGEGINSKIEKSVFKLNTGITEGEYIGWSNSATTGASQPTEYDIIECTFDLNRDSRNGVVNPYTPELVKKGIFRNCRNTKFKIIDKEILIGENSLSTKIKKSIGDNNTGKNLIKLEMPSIVIGQNSFAGTCKIEGTLTNSNKTNVETASANFVSTFSFSSNASTLSVAVSPVITTITSSISTNAAVIDITGLNYAIPVVNYKPDAFQLGVNVTPVTTGTSTEEIFLTGKVDIFYSDTAKDNIVIDY